MDIYIVQEGDDIQSIADRFEISAEKLIIDNGLQFPYNLVVGQTIVIAYPKQTYTVKEGDTLESIANLYNVSIMQILRNNPFLSEREYIYQGEILIISYDTKSSIETFGIAYPYIKRETLIKTLPNLTYISILNYTASEKGEIITYQDDSEIIKTSKEYGTVPLILLTTLSVSGQPNIETAYNILLNKEYQERHTNELVDIMKSKGYQGVNIVFNYLNENNQSLYLDFIKTISDRLQQEGLLFFLTVNYKLKENDSIDTLSRISYSEFAEYLDAMIFISLVWSSNIGPPAPVSNINFIRLLMDYVTSKVSSDKIIIGKPTIGYDWQLPYIPGRSNTTSMSIDSAILLASQSGAAIQFDEESFTPYFSYNQLIGLPIEHIVWFIDARSINALNDLILQKSIKGSGIWNIMIYYPQLWTLINSLFDTKKIL